MEENHLFSINVRREREKDEDPFHPLDEEEEKKRKEIN